MKKIACILMILLPLASMAQERPISERSLRKAHKKALLAETQVLQVSQEPFFTIGQAYMVPEEMEKVDLEKLMTEYSQNPDYSSFEINEEMFKAFCELEYVDSATNALFSKIKSVKMIEVKVCEDIQDQLEYDPEYKEPLNTDFYNYVIDRLDLTGYNTLLKSSNSQSLTLLLKKELSQNKNLQPINEFLLITDKLLIDIQGAIVIKTIYQMQELMQYVQQILTD